MVLQVIIKYQQPIHQNQLVNFHISLKGGACSPLSELYFGLVAFRLGTSSNQLLALPHPYPAPSSLSGAAQIALLTHIHVCRPLSATCDPPGGPSFRPPHVNFSWGCSGSQSSHFSSNGTVFAFNSRMPADRDRLFNIRG